MRKTALQRKNQTDRFYQLIWPHAATVLCTAQMLCRNSSEADDLAQDTMLKAFKAMKSFREGTDAKAWLLQILRNARIDRLRSRKPEAVAFSLDAGNVDLPAPSEVRQTKDESVWSDPAAMSAMPVDLSRPNKSICAAVPRYREGSLHSLTMWMRSARGAAASVLFLVLAITLVIASSTGPAIASPERLAAIHGEVCSCQA